MNTLRVCLTATISVSVFLLVARESAGQPAFAMPSQTEMRSSDWTARRDAFARLLGVDPVVYSRGGFDRVTDVVRNALMIQAIDDQRRIALIELMESENKIVAERDRQTRARSDRYQSSGLAEEYVNYYGDLIAAVATLGDQRALPALLGAIKTGGMAMNALASFGAPAVEPVASLLESDDSAERYGAALTLWRMLEQSPTGIDGLSRSRIKDALVKASADTYPTVRQAAVVGLVALGDAESIALVNRIAERDTYRAEYQEGQPYVVREAAARALLRPVKPQ